MSQLASVGDFCPNPECENYGDVEAKVVNAINVNRAKRLSMSAKGRCFTSARPKKKTSLSVLLCWQRVFGLVVSVVVKASRKILFYRFYAKQLVMRKQSKRFY